MCASPAEGSLLDALVAVHAVLDDQQIGHALCGGIAANLYREAVRATTDVDIYIVCGGPQLVSLTRAFEQRGWEAHPAWRQAELLRVTRSDLPLVDLLIASTDFEREAVGRALLAIIDEMAIRVLTPEDLIVLKLVAGRERDYGDVAAIINSQASDLDANFIESTLAEFGMDDRWPRAVAAAARDAENRG